MKISFIDRMISVIYTFICKFCSIFRLYLLHATTHDDPWSKEFILSAAALSFVWRYSRNRT